jgi:hypothetical protein
MFLQKTNREGFFMKHAIGIFIVMPAFLILTLSVWGMDYIVWFLDAPTLFSFIVILFVWYLVIGELKTFVKAVNAMFSKKYVISPEDLEKSISLMRFSAKVVNYTAIFQITGSAIILMAELDDLANLGPILAVTLISVLYATMLQIGFFLPAIHILEKRKGM